MLTMVSIERLHVIINICMLFSVWLHVYNHVENNMQPFNIATVQWAHCNVATLKGCMFPRGNSSQVHVNPYVQKYNIITLANKLYQYNIRLYIVREQDNSVIYNWPKAKSDHEVNKYWTVEIEYYNPKLIVFVAALQIKGSRQQLKQLTIATRCKPQPTYKTTTWRCFSLVRSIISQLS